VQVEKAKEFMRAEKYNKGLLVADHMFRHVLEICNNLYLLANGKTHLVNSFEDIETFGYAQL